MKETFLGAIGTGDYCILDEVIAGWVPAEQKEAMKGCVVRVQEICNQQSEVFFSSKDLQKFRRNKNRIVRAITNSIPLHTDTKVLYEENLKSKQ